MKQVCNNQLVMKFIALAKEVGMVLKDGVGREMNVQNLGEIGKSWSEDASAESVRKFAHVAYVSWGENPGWEIAMEKIVMQELKFKYDEEGFDLKKKPCIQRMLTDRKCEIVNNFNRCSYRKNGHKCLISRKPEDITLKNKYHKRNKKKTYLTEDLGSSINKELKEVMNDVVSEEKMSKMERMKKMSDN